MNYPLSDIAIQILEKRYIHKELGESTWDDVVERVVKHVLEGQQLPEFPNAVARLRNLIRERYFLPNSPTLVNSGTTVNGLSACFVVPFGDSIEEIVKTKYYFMKICQKGGGCGTSLSNIRPEGSFVGGSTHAYAAGPIKFFNTICEDMKAMTQATFREMAMMGTLGCEHPDIEKFIRAKEKEGVMHTTNLSVMATDKFMEAALAGEEWLTSFETPRETIQRTFNAGKLLDLIARSAWSNGEPGLLFQDTINLYTPYRHSSQYIDACNPCAEQPLPSFGTCNLGSIDVSKFVEGGKVNYEALREAAYLAAFFLDCVVDVASWPLPEIAEWVRDNRPIGLGVMGFADLLLKCGIVYGSEESIEMVHNLGEAIFAPAREASELLGSLKGVPKSCAALSRPRRNITLTTIAPTGTIALIAGCSHGVEPIFSPKTTRTDKTGTYEISHPMAGDSHFRSAVNEDPTKIVPWKAHIDIQAAWQKWADSGVSKTINFPNTATVEDVKEAMIYAWTVHCKGITVYRDGSRNEQVLRQSTEPDTIKRPRVMNSKTVRINIGDERHYVTVSSSDDGPYEVFVNAPSILLPDVQMRDGFSRLSSLALRYKVPVKELIKELRQIPAQSLKSVPLVIASVLEELFTTATCPECGKELHFLDGCATCSSCGYSKCNGG